MKKLMTLLGLASVLGLCLVGSAAGSAPTFTASTKIPVDIVVFVPCANGGAGEIVELTGNLHDLFSFTFDGSGGAHVMQVDNPQGISGTGQTTGAKYQATGETLNTFNAQVGLETTFVNNFKIIGQGPGNNFLIHENFHLTVNANGTVTAFVDNFSVTCK